MDLDGDGKSEVAVGSTYVYALGGDGKVRWRDRFAHWRGADLGECRALSVADVNGDGRGEVIASYYAPYAATRVLDGDGKALQSARLNTGGAGFYTNTPLCNTTLDLDGDGKSEVLVGDTQFVLGSAPAAAEPQGQLLWMGAATHLGSVARKGEGPLLAAALESGDVVALGHRASAGPFVVDGAWCAGVRARITGFQAADLDGDGTAEVVVATRRRGLRVLTAAGKESAWDAETAPDVAVLAAGAGCVLGGTADGRLIRWVRER